MTALYVRVSTAEQAKEGYSIDEQIERLSAYCKAMNWTVLRTYVDAGCSGGNTDRPELQNLIRDIKAGLIRRVVVYKLDRLSRSQKDTLELIEDVFLANGCDFVSLSENFDTGTPFGRAMIGILAVFAQLEREQIKERMNLGRTGRAKKGLYHGGGLPPVGYDYTDGELIINPFDAMQVREIYEMFLTGMPIRRICDNLEKRGLRHTHGKWIEATIRKVLSNDVYIGRVRFDGQSYQGTHDPIIDEETFHKAQRLLSDTKQSKASSQSSLLGGLLWCRQCGARYGVSCHTWHGKTYKYYACYSRSKAHRQMVRDPACQNKTYKMEDLDNIILSEIRKLSLEEIPESEQDTSRQAIIADQISKLESQKQRLMSLYSLGEFSVEELQALVTPINEQREKLQKEALSEDKTITAVEAQEAISSLEDILSRGNHDEARMVITALVDRIEIDGDDILIHWKF